MPERYDEVLNPLVALRARIEALGAAHGLDVRQVVIIPSADGEHEVHLAVTTIPDWTGVDCTAEFNELIAGARQAELEQQAEVARTDLQDQLRARLDTEQGGFLD